jgi:hypothetical protein
VKVDELLWTRKVLLLEAFDQHALQVRAQRRRVDPDAPPADDAHALSPRETIAFADFVRILSEILNVSLSWKRCAMLLLLDEDKCFPAHSWYSFEDYSTPSAAAATASAATVSVVLDEKELKQRQQRERQGDFTVFYKQVLDRYDDEVTSFVKRKEEEASRASMDVLQHYLQALNDDNSGSIDSSTAVAGTESDSGAAAMSTSTTTTATELDVIQVDLSDHGVASTATGPVTVPEVTTASTKRTSSATGTGTTSQQFHGHLISCALVQSLYPNWAQLESAFAALDGDQDGYFDVEDFRRVCVDLQLMESTADSFPAPYSGGVPRTGSGSSAQHAKQTLLHIPTNPQQQQQQQLQLQQQQQSSSSVDEVQLFSILDVQQCGQVDVNVFFEMCRICVMNSLHPDDAASRPQLARELSYTAETRRLTQTSSSVALLSLAGAGTTTHTPSHTTLTSVELKKGVEIGVDAELAAPQRSGDAVDVAELDI